MNVEHEEAKEIVDQLAREIHGIYGQHATDAGFKAPKWEEIPESAKGISRDISRLVLAKMQEAFTEGMKQAASKAAPAPPAPPPARSMEDVLRLVKELKGEALDVIARIKEGGPAPLIKGIDDAIRKLSEKLTLDVVSENPELLAKLRQIVEKYVVNGLLEDKEEPDA